jgi:hypothetical protein
MTTDLLPMLRIARQSVGSSSSAPAEKKKRASSKKGSTTSSNKGKSKANSKATAKAKAKSKGKASSKKGSKRKADSSDDDDETKGSDKSDDEEEEDEGDDEKKAMTLSNNRLGELGEDALILVSKISCELVTLGFQPDSSTATNWPVPQLLECCNTLRDLMAAQLSSCMLPSLHHRWIFTIWFDLLSSGI